ncbi:MAG: hypothetical protein LC798_21265 [Chloroflexi bacterium]|nr:hypothetical protein [Chloroflexota bacterium]
MTAPDIPAAVAEAIGRNDTTSAPCVIVMPVFAVRNDAPAGELIVESARATVCVAPDGVPVNVIRRSVTRGDVAVVNAEPI